MRMQSLLNRALFGKRKGDLKDYTNDLKETFAQEKKAKKVLIRHGICPKFYTAGFSG